jgi:hypothetical protein
MLSHRFASLTVNCVNSKLSSHPSILQKAPSQRASAGVLRDPQINIKHRRTHSCETSCETSFDSTFTDQSSKLGPRNLSFIDSTWPFSPAVSISHFIMDNDILTDFSILNIFWSLHDTRLYGANGRVMLARSAVVTSYLNPTTVLILPNPYSLSCPMIVAIQITTMTVEPGNYDAEGEGGLSPCYSLSDEYYLKDSTHLNYWSTNWELDL